MESIVLEKFGKGPINVAIISPIFFNVESDSVCPYLASATLSTNSSDTPRKLFNMKSIKKGEINIDKIKRNTIVFLFFLDETKPIMNVTTRISVMDNLKNAVRAIQNDR